MNETSPVPRRLRVERENHHSPDLGEMSKDASPAGQYFYRKPLTMRE